MATTEELVTEATTLSTANGDVSYKDGVPTGKSSDESETADVGSWRELLASFTQQTTLHGIRYVTAASKYIVRRVVWCSVLLIAAVLVIFFASTKLAFYFQYPTTVSVGVVYTDHVTFPAVTMCNMNPFKLTALQKMGLYDTLTSKGLMGTPSEPASSRNEDYYFLHGLCSLPERYRNVSRSVHVYNETTRSVCRHLCSTLHDDTCSSFLFDFARRSCVLSPYMAGDDDPITDCGNTSVEFYRRERYVVNARVLCNFESEGCEFVNDTSGRDSWKSTIAKNGKITKDHTLNTGFGHYIYMSETNLRPNYAAALRTRYLRTSDKCLEFYYQAMGIAKSFIRVRAIGENLHQTLLLNTSATNNAKWNRLFVRLLPGKYQLHIEGVRGQGTTGVALDDLRISACEEAYQECSRTPDGTSYLGTQAVTARGDTCQPWVHSGVESDEDFPDGSSVRAQNYCRNPNGDPQGPWCYTRQPRMDYCNISHCACSSDEYECTSGRCIPSRLTCNGIGDCPDSSDELLPCGRNFSVTCDFEEAYMCGYRTSRESVLQWVRHRSHAENAVQRPQTDSHNSNFGYYIYLYTLGNMRKNKGSLELPELRLNDSAMMSLYLYMEAHERDTTTRLAVYRISNPAVAWQHLYSFQVAGSRTHAEHSHTVRLTGGQWSMQEICLPAGTHSLVFEGTVGTADRTVIALDDVTVYPEQCTVSNSQDRNEEWLATEPKVKERTVKRSKECFVFRDATDYSGTISMTETGKVCQRWDAHWPHVHSYTFPESNITNVHNYCRNPRGLRTRPWCYTMDPDTAWEYCKIFQCPGECFELPTLTYRGKLNRTDLGYECQRWDSQSPHAHMHKDAEMPELSLRLAENYCRNPEMESMAWCFTTNPDVRWDWCSIPTCPFESDETEDIIECRMGENGYEYNGHIRETVNNVSCQRWDKQTPHVHSISGWQLPEGSLSLAESYCRNPESLAGARPWCYTTDPDTRWDYCDVPKCESSECFWRKDGSDYVGNVSTTVNGKTCQRWDSNEPHESKYLGEKYYTDGNASTANNYCRKVGVAALPWCYTMDPDDRWQYCNVSRCTDLLSETTARHVIYETATKHARDLLFKSRVNTGCFWTKSGRDYVGSVSTTVNNRVCQSWAAKEPHRHHLNDSDFLEGSLLRARNFCRNPNGRRWPWCYATDPLVEWEYCDVEKCAEECYHSLDGADYYGALAVSTRGLLCIPWTEGPPVNDQDSSANTRVKLVRNYCRNPDGRSRPWCFTDDPTIPWDYCDIGPCQRECQQLRDADRFIGRVNVTESGATCLRWDSLPNSQGSQKLKPTARLHDTCSAFDPRERPWCFVYNSSAEQDGITKEHCAVSHCPSDIDQAATCSFEGGESCGYTTRTSSLNLRWTHIPRRYIEQASAEKYHLTSGTCASCHYDLLGSLTSPGFPEDYPNRNECTHHFVQPPGTVVKLKFLWMDIEDESSCEFDRLQVVSKNDLVFHETPICGINTLDSLTTYENDFNLTFTSDYSLRRSGYVIEYIMEPPPGIEYLLVLDMQLPQRSADIYTAHLISPDITMTSDGCMTLDLYLDVRDGSLDIRRYSPHDDAAGMCLYETHRGLGRDIHRVQVALPGMEEQFHLVFTATDTGHQNHIMAGLDNILLTQGTCFSNAVESSLSCDFEEETICGYHSLAAMRWHRVYISDGPNRWMEVEFLPGTRGPIELTSPLVNLLEECCLSFNHTSKGSPYLALQLRVVLSSALNLRADVSLQATRAASKQSIADGTGLQRAQITLPVGQYRVVFQAFGFTRDLLVVDDIEMFTGPCSTPNLEFEEDIAKHLSWTPTTQRTHVRRDPSESAKHVGYDYKLSFGHLDIIDRAMADFNLSRFAFEAAPYMSDLIHSCKWNGQECKTEHISMSTTDSGICYTFNNMQEGPLDAKRRGSEFGLRLVLNVERYEHVSLPQVTSNVKVYLHSGKDIAAVRDLGVMIGPGFHVAGPINYDIAVNLGEPYDHCSNAELEYYAGQNYSVARCQAQCVVKDVESKCGCKDMYMPGPSEVCSFRKFLTCLLPARGQHTTLRNCTCSEACEVHTFSPELSLSALSGNIESSILSGKNRGIIEKKLKDAVQLRYRSDSELFCGTMKPLLGFGKRLRQFIRTFIIKVVRKETSIVYAMERTIQKISELVMDDIVYNLFSQLGSFTTEYYSVLDATMLSNVKSLSDARESLLQLTTLINLRDHRSSHKLYSEPPRTEIITHIYEQVLLANWTLMATWTSRSHFHGNLIPPHYVPPTDPLNNRCKMYRDTMQLLLPQVLAALQDLKNGDGYGVEDSSVHFGEALKVLATCMNHYKEFLQDTNSWLTNARRDIEHMGSLNYGRAIYKEELLHAEKEARYDDYISAVIGQTSRNELSWSELVAVLDGPVMQEMMNNMEAIIQDLQFLLDPIKNRLNNLQNSIPEIYQEGLAKLVNLQGYFQDVRVFGTFEDYAKLMNIWRRPNANIEQADIITFEHPRDEIWKSWPKSERVETFSKDGASVVIQEIVDDMVSGLLVTLNDLTNEFDSLRNDVRAEEKLLRARLAHFEESVHINDKFIKENFLSLDVYFAELKYQKVEQQPAYELSNFFGDMGGFLGLFLGASIMTVMEFLDFVVFNIYSRIQAKTTSDSAKRKKQPSATDLKKQANSSIIYVRDEPVA